MSARPNKEFTISDSNLWKVPIEVLSKGHVVIKDTLQVVATTAHGATLAAQANARLWKTNFDVPSHIRYKTGKPELVQGIAVAVWKVGE